MYIVIKSIKSDFNIIVRNKADLSNLERYFVVSHGALCRCRRGNDCPKNTERHEHATHFSLRAKFTRAALFREMAVPEGGS